MRRNARTNQSAEDPHSTILYQNTSPKVSDSSDNFLQMNAISTRNSAHNNNTHRFENTIEAKVETDDTLQAIALRFHCTVADIKRLNRIDKENEIHARKVVKIPVTVHNVLLDNLPTVHKSGNNSPKPGQRSHGDNSRDSRSDFNSIVRNPLEDAEAVLSEKLMVASVNSSGSNQLINSKATPIEPANINSVILNSKIISDSLNIYSDMLTNNVEDVSAPLITNILDDSNVPMLHRIRGPSLRAMDWSGSDCDMSWVCLFVVILALCFVIPLVYVFYIAEHAHHNTTGSIAPSHH
ncbi:uncharacterized protein ACRADG_011976 isoform 2-T2 [Cochliomyia hominivorax]